MRHADAGHQVVPGGGGVLAVLPAVLHVAEALAVLQRVEERVEEREPRLVGLRPGLVQEGAEPGPDRGAQARAADLRVLPVQADVGPGVRVAHGANVRDHAAVAERGIQPALERRAGERLMAVVLRESRHKY